jgi:predicted HicB family RNase H-like nuclease
VRRYIVRQSFTVRAEFKSALNARAAASEMSLNAYVRDKIADLQAEHALAIACAEFELRQGVNIL